MISAKDLRVHNLVYKSLKSGQGRKLEVEIDVDDLVKIVTDTGSFNYEPIPLTEEWLQRFGFIKKISASYATGDRVEFNTWSKEELTYNSIQDSWWFNGRILKFQPRYVHTLQNLTHSLTNQELTIG